MSATVTQLHPDISAFEVFTDEEEPAAYANAFSLSDNLASGYLPGLVFIEGDHAIHLDESDTDEVLAKLPDRGLVLLRSLVELAATRIYAESSKRDSILRDPLRRW
jgi:hypothetical protein